MTEATISLEEGKSRWPRRFARAVAWTLGALLMLLVVLYLAALIDQRYQARRAVRLYDQLLTVRLGDTVAEFNRKVPDCNIGHADGEYSCFVQSTAQRIEGHHLWYLWAHERVDEWQSINRQKTGLRDWYLMPKIWVRQGRLSEVSMQFFVTGRDRMLGFFWELTPKVPPGILDPEAATKPKISTYLGGTHITGWWSGSGYHMEFTPGSSTQDLRMREINAGCLTSFAGCSDSRELLPNVPPPGHPRYW